MAESLSLEAMATGKEDLFGSLIASLPCLSSHGPGPALEGASSLSLTWSSAQRLSGTLGIFFFPGQPHIDYRALQGVLMCLPPSWAQLSPCLPPATSLPPIPSVYFVVGSSDPQVFFLIPWCIQAGQRSGGGTLPRPGSRTHKIPHLLSRP